MNETLTDGNNFFLPCKECAGASGAQWLGWSCTFLFGRGWLNVICGFFYVRDPRRGQEGVGEVIVGFVWPRPSSGKGGSRMSIFFVGL